MVIYSHSFELMNTNMMNYLKYFLNIDLGYVAVNVFFFLSGMLIYNSALNSKNLINYFWKRSLRIYPALFICIFLTILIFWIDSSSSFLEYLKININYLSNLIFIGKYTISEIFDNNYYAFVANGSLWTLRYEIIMYIITGIFTISFFRDKKSILYIIFMIFFLLFIFTLNDDKSAITNISRLGSYFFIGALLSNYSVLKMNKYILFSILFISSILYFILAGLKSIFIFIIIIGLIKYSLDYIKEKEKNKIKINFDISYGLYIYAFPIQQFLIKYISFDNVYIYFVSSLIITTIIAFLSWTVIESKSLKLKNAF